MDDKERRELIRRARVYAQRRAGDHMLEQVADELEAAINEKHTLLWTIRRKFEDSLEEVERIDSTGGGHYTEARGAGKPPSELGAPGEAIRRGRDDTEEERQRRLQIARQQLHSQGIHTSGDDVCDTLLFKLAASAQRLDREMAKAIRRMRGEG